jgi:hypothetical protein
MLIERNPELNNEQVQGFVDAYLKAREAVKKAISPYRSEVPVEINPDGKPFKLVHVGDTHFGHDHSDPDGLKDAVNESGNSIMALHGNIVDGVSPKFISTNTINVAFNLDEQTDIVRRLLKEKDSKGQVIPITGHGCHEGWAVKNATHDPVRDIVDHETPILYQGGQIIFTKDGDRKGSVELYHNPGSGSTKLSPEGSIRARYRETPAEHPDRPTAIVSGHTHMLVAGQDVAHVPNDSDVVTSYGITGTAKGSKENPDTFLISKGVPPRNQPADAGRGLVTIWEQKGDEKLDCYPVAGYERANILFRAKSLLCDIQQNDATEDLKKQIIKTGKFRQPKIKLDKGESRERGKDSASVSEGQSPIYKKLEYDVVSNLPLILHFIGNIRFGSTTLMREPLEDVMNTIDKNPWAFFTLTRRLINTDIPFRSDRKDVLENMSDFFASSKKSLLGIMITDALAVKKWVKNIGPDSKGFYPGDYLYKESPLKKVPLIAPETEISLNTSGTNYNLLVRDKLSHFTSLINIAHGLTRVGQIWGSTADAYIGGHTEVVGWRTWMRPWGQLEVIIPGGYSEFIEKGVGNRVDYPLGGQGLILFPERKLLYSFADAKKGEEMHQALWFYSALNQMGTLEKTEDKLKYKPQK